LNSKYFCCELHKSSICYSRNRGKIINVEQINQYWQEVIKLTTGLRPDDRFSTPEVVEYINGHLPADSETMTKTKVNYLRVQEIVTPEDGGGELRTSWRYTPEDVRRILLVELLKTRAKLSIQEAKGWLLSFFREDRPESATRLNPAVSDFVSNDLSGQDLLDVKSATRLNLAISGFVSDDLSGQDLLDVNKEVDVLCSVLAAKDVEPPLALGLFGDWGSGKSFFMRMMQDRIEKLKEAAQQTIGETAFCKNIVQLKFNAWHYIDTELWASLTSEIFEGLARALAKKEDPDSEYKRACLLANIIKSKEELVQADQEKKEADAKLLESQQHLKQLEHEEAAIEVSLTPQAILQGAWHIASRQPEILKIFEETKKDLNEKIEKAALELNYSSTDAITVDLKTRLLDLHGFAGARQAFAIALRNSKDRRSSLFLGASLLIFALLIVIGLLILYRAYVLGMLSSVIALVVAIILFLAPLIPGVQRALILINQAQVESKNLLKEERQRRQNDLKQKYERLQREVKEAQLHLKEAQMRLEKASEEVRGNEQEIEALHADRQMSNFIKQRQASTVYTKHLGVIAQAREDFAKLSFLLAKEKENINRGITAEQEGQLLPPIDRIILYIDDLDRCPENHVVDVLQAVHLLLAFPLFIVVVGVDSRWLLHSLKQNSRAFQSEASEHDGIPDEDYDQWQSTPLNYLEKIFQIPYTLRPMQASGFERLVDALTTQQKNIPLIEIKSEQNVIDEVKTTFKLDTTYQDNESTSSVNKHEITELPLSPTSLSQTTLEDLPHSDNAPLLEYIDLNPGYLLIEEWERTVMKKLYRFIPSPRSAKRFVNIYRLLKASIDDLKLQVFIGDENHGQHRCVLLLLAMLIGHPVETLEILRELLERKHTDTWWDFIDTFKSRAELSIPSDDIGTSMDVSGQQIKRWRQLLEKLTEIEVRSLLPKDHSCADFEEYAPLVARYSYQSRSILFAE
jgi:hypothetical protein